MPFPADAGKKIGLEIWRIEKMEPAAVARADYGKFFCGDCYIVLQTYEKSGSIYQDLHFWLGEDSSQDERGAAAYQTVFLDDQLGGKPVQYREVQGHESAKFVSYFPNLQYLKGGVDSAFNHVGPAQYKPRLLHLKGKRNVRVQEVPLSVNSMNQGDVFVLDCGLTLYQWNGPSSNKYEKFKGLELVTHIKDDERGGKAEIVVLEGGKNDSNEQFWHTLGGKQAVPGAEAGGSDDEVKEAATTLYHVSGSNLTQVATGILERSLLESSETYLLDHGNEVFVWIGKHSDAQKKKKIMQQASEFLSASNRPDWTPISRVAEGVEPSSFKQLFKQWNPPRVVGVGASKPVEEKVDLEALAVRQHAEEKMVDDAKGALQIWRIENLQKVVVPKEQYGQFFAGDSYILLYTYQVKNKEQHLIYFWQGRQSSQDEKAASALLTVDLHGSLKGDPVQVRVVQNKEPNHFLCLFKGRMVVHDGGVAAAFKNRNDVTTIDLDSVGLYHIRGTTDVNTRGVQVPAAASSLNSSDCFVLRSGDAIYVWKGQGANGHETNVATNIANVIKGNRNVVTIEEGSEPDAFWDALGGRGEYPKSKTLESGGFEPRLFHCTTAARGFFTVNEIPNFSQEDLINDDVMILDTYDEVFVWVGHDATRTEHDKAIQTATDYIQNAKDGRSHDTPIFKVLAGSEPPNFTCHFRGWNEDKASDFTDPYLAKLNALKTSGAASHESKAPLQRVTTADTGFAKPGTTTYTAAQLKSGQAPNIDPAVKESYLSNEEFVSLFKMDKAAFNALPKWKRDQAKKSVGLF